ncbi:kinesin-like protein KIF3B [Daktulosphaira vitifoliae]|uniref:kinesin-like protein KIF3B n=1 Tax=Daktulosphaira vitifoliae TaxID=58002 RepID=UPI0021AAA9A4|nr:kinesin-like protein KIF3B [Daktulosphaira vitifoliae]
MDIKKRVIRQQSAKTKKENIQVIVRCRPMSSKEISNGYSEVVKIIKEENSVAVAVPKNDGSEFKQFTFDSVFDWNSTQEELYNKMVHPLIESVLNGFNATIFAYGQTGTGKTYTMEGVKDDNFPIGDQINRGIIPRTFEQIFNSIELSNNTEYLVFSSYLEIYQEEIRDLLEAKPKGKCELREDKDVGVYVNDLNKYICKNVQEILKVMHEGNKNRTVGATDMNEHSSRSHAIFTVTVEIKVSAERIRVGKLNLVDLAGSERQSKSGATGQRLKEAGKINLSLSTLGNVIHALVEENSTHIPYRDSKLTRLLQDSLGGNSKTLMIANIGPASYNWDETLTTLRYANRAKNIHNAPHVNEDPKDALIRQYQDEISKLRNILNEKSSKKTIRKEKNYDIENFQEHTKYLEKQQEDLNEKRNNILENKDNLSSDDQNRMLHDIELEKAKVAGEMDFMASLIGRIQSMESSLLRGGKSITDHLYEQQSQIDKRNKEIQEEIRLEQELAKNLEEIAGYTESIRETYSTLLEEVESKQGKFDKLFVLYQNLKGELKKKEEYYSIKRRENESNQEAMTKQLKLGNIIMSNFIAPDELQGVKDRLIYDDDTHEWRLISNQLEGHTRGCINGVINSRKNENLITLNLLTLEHKLEEYKKPEISPSLLSMLDEALKVEDDLQVDASIAIRPRSVRSAVGPKIKPTTSRNYPRARGLIPK